MTLKHVTQNTRVFVVRRTIADIDLLQNGYLDMVDVVPVPERLKDGVTESEHQQVLHSVFA